MCDKHSQLLFVLAESDLLGGVVIVQCIASTIVLAVRPVYRGKRSGYEIPMLGRSPAMNSLRLFTQLFDFAGCPALSW